MKILLTDKENLELDIIRLLLNQTDWLTMKSAATQLNISESQFSTSYQNILKRPINQELDIVLQRNKGLKISNRQISMSSIVFDYISESLTFKILDNAFQKGDGIEKFCIHNHISTSVFYKTANFLNVILEKNHLFLNIKKMQIEGNESYARAFLFNTYWITFQNEAWPFKSLNEGTIQSQANAISERTSLAMNHLEIRHLKYRLAIYSIRMYKKHYMIDLPNDVIPPVILEQVKNNFKDLFGWANPSVMERELIGIALASCYYPRGKAAYNVSTEDILTWHRKMNTVPHQLSQRFVKLCVEDGMPNIDASVWLDLLNVHTLAYMLPDLYIDNFREEMSLAYQKSVPAIHAKAVTYCDTIYSDSDSYNLLDREMLLHYYDSFLIRILNDNPMEHMNILLLSDKDRASALSLSIILKNLIPYPVYIFTDKKEQEPDLILSDSNLTESASHPVLFLSFPPKDTEIAEINQYIKEHLRI